MSYKIIDHYRLLLTISVYLFRIYSLKDESLCNLLIIQTCFSFVRNFYLYPKSKLNSGAFLERTLH